MNKPEIKTYKICKVIHKFDLISKVFDFKLGDYINAIRTKALIDVQYSIDKEIKNNTKLEYSIYWRLGILDREIEAREIEPFNYCSFEELTSSYYFNQAEVIKLFIEVKVIHKLLIDNFYLVICYTNRQACESLRSSLTREFMLYLSNLIDR